MLSSSSNSTRQARKRKRRPRSGDGRTSVATPRVGIDFGNTITIVGHGDLAPQALDMIRHLVHKFGSANVYIISKAGPNVEQEIRDFLDALDFFTITNFSKQNVIFVREYHEKATWVQSLGITIFFDDHIKVVQSLLPIPTLDRVFWMHANTVQLVQHIPKQYRHKLALTGHWANTMKYFQKIPSRNR